MKTDICKRLGIEFPIFAFSHCRDVVAAVSRAGGFGVLGAVAFSPEELEIELQWIDANVGGKPYGVDTVIPAAYLGKGDGDLAKLDLEEMIPSQHRAWIEHLLDKHGVPKLPDAVEATVETAAGRERLAGRFLIGADGSKSAVRGALGIDFEGLLIPRQSLVESAKLE